MKRITVSLVLVICLLMSSFGVQAQNSRTSGTQQPTTSTTNFQDVPQTHWAFDAIQLMSDYGIIDGTGNGYFNPNGNVTRAEFAKMMVLTLHLDSASSSISSFLDVKASDWYFKYVEAAKKYLTVYKSTAGYNFKPNGLAVREDLAVAIVKGLNLDISKADLTVLSKLNDPLSISPALKAYAAVAITEGIMVGDANKNFNANGNITRAEVATLLARLITEDKVTFDDETKVTYDATSGAISTSSSAVTTGAFNLTYTTQNAYVKLNWTPQSSDGFKYYKVVLSKNDATPSYPENGYLTYITNSATVTQWIKPGSNYENGDFGKKVTGGTYYVSITAVYNDKRLVSNVLKLNIPGSSDKPVEDNDSENDHHSSDDHPTTTISSIERTPVLTGSTITGGAILAWTKTNSTNFTYYKVVLSKSDSTPSYPDNGYYVYTTDINDVSELVKIGDAYNSGDLGGKIVAGQTYYISITAVYGDAKYTSNVIKLTMPAQ